MEIIGDAGHASLTQGGTVHAAGTFDVNEAGQITSFDNWSGYYIPGDTPGFTPLEKISRDAFAEHGLSAHPDAAMEISGWVAGRLIHKHS